MKDERPKTSSFDQTSHNRLREQVFSFPDPLAHLDPESLGPLPKLRAIEKSSATRTQLLRQRFLGIFGAISANILVVICIKDMRPLHLETVLLPVGVPLLFGALCLYGAFSSSFLRKYHIFKLLLWLAPLVCIVPIFFIPAKGLSLFNYSLKCIGAALFFSVAPLLPLTSISFHRFVHYTLIRSMLLSAAVSLVGYGFSRLVCTHDERHHVFIFHFVPLLIFGYLIGRLIPRLTRV